MPSGYYMFYNNPMIVSFVAFPCYSCIYSQINYVLNAGIYVFVVLCVCSQAKSPYNIAQLLNWI